MVMKRAKVTVTVRYLHKEGLSGLQSVAMRMSDWRSF